MSAALQTAKLGEIAELNPRLAESLESNAPVSFVPMSAVTAETASTTTGAERQYSEVSKGYTPFRDGDVLVAKITPCFENGKIAQATISHRIGFGSTEFHVVRPINGKSDARYLLHFLRQERIRRDGERKMTGSAGQRRVPEHFLAGIEIPLPPLAEQRRIAELLDQAEALRAKRRAALAQLDTLIQAIFIDMFGDPATNPKGWRRNALCGITSKITDGEHLNPVFSAVGMPIVMAGNVLDDLVDLRTAKTVDSTLGERFRKKCNPEKGDLLLVSRGATIGRLCSIDFTDRFCLMGSVILIKPDSGLLDKKYLSALLKHPLMWEKLYAASGSSAQQAIYLKDIKRLSCPLPPLDLQREFAHRVAAVEKLKTAYRASLAEMDALFASLQHRAFRGEL